MRGWQGEGEVNSWDGMRRKPRFAPRTWVKMLCKEEEVSVFQSCTRLWEGGSQCVHLMPSKPASVPLLPSQRPGH